MRTSFLARTLAPLAIVVSLSLPTFAQRVLGKGQAGPVPDPVVLDEKGLFQDKFVSVGDDMFIGGQPTEKALRDLKAKGVTTVVNLRMPEEMARVGFDEAALGRLHGPVGLRIGARSPAEIAVSILAQIIEKLRQGV